MAVNTHLLNWYLDQAGSYFGLIISIACLILILPKLYGNKNTDLHVQDKGYHKSFKRSILCVYITSILFFIFASLTYVGLPIFKYISPSISQVKICLVTHIFRVLFICLVQVAILNLFIQRLHLSFKDSQYSLSKCSNYGFRIFWFFMYTVLAITLLLSSDPLPFNVYTQQFDLNGNGIT